MKLHGNAELTLKKRELLASRVVEEGWSLARRMSRSPWNLVAVQE